MSLILTHSGKYVDLMAPTPDDVELEDVAVALSSIARFSGHGHGDETYTVAEHSVRVSWALEEIGCSTNLCLAALLHDGAEAYLGDVSSPLKHLPEWQTYREAEDRWLAAIFEALDVPVTLRRSAIVKWFDLVLMATERRDLMPAVDYVGGANPWACIEGVKPLDDVIVPWSKAQAKKAFLSRFDALTNGLDEQDDPRMVADYFSTVELGPVGEPMPHCPEFASAFKPGGEPDVVVSIESIDLGDVIPALAGLGGRIAEAAAAPAREDDVERESVCAEADRLVSGDRQDDYGHPLDDFTKVVEAAKALGIDPINGGPEHHSLYMAIVKIARETNRPKRDNRVDLAGYAKTLDMVITERERRASA